MPFGLTNAPATFQRLMNQLFSGIDWEFVFTYLDKIVSKSFEEHLSHVRSVLERLQEAGLRLKPEKCAFVKSEIDYLEFILSATGFRPNFKKVEAIHHFPRPKRVKDVQSFLGMVNFYRRHVPNMAVKARPLTALTRKDKATVKPVAFEWSSECEQAFIELKHFFVLCTSTSSTGLVKTVFSMDRCMRVGYWSTS